MESKRVANEARSDDRERLKGKEEDSSLTLEATGDGGRAAASC
jgi:hypothetical protein